MGLRLSQGKDDVVGNPMYKPVMGRFASPFWSVVLIVQFASCKRAKEFFFLLFSSKKNNRKTCCGKNILSRKEKRGTV